MAYHFFAAISRMKYIDRWQLMRNSREENLCEHSMEVGMIAHALCVIGNVRYGKNLDADRAAVIGLYHDASEIITGDMPTPVKYYGDEIRTAYKKVEAVAENRLLDKLPEDLAPVYRSIFGTPDPQAELSDADYEEKENPDPAAAEAAESERYMRRLVKAADKLSALIKCMDETAAGNTEFRTAMQSTMKSLDAMAAELPELQDFMEEFLPSYGHTLDELA
ncbi:MAG: 5'-deoxynucleotidase [Lachnospiraceae bacterium]|nr:5'-deoxynucleotidase [Lachnospiraceae bacterium]